MLKNALIKIQIIWKTAAYFGMICILDHCPEFLKRKMLTGEYEGEALERRINMRLNSDSWCLIKALYRMSSINLYPGVKNSDRVPKGLMVQRLEDGKLVDLCSLQRSTRPLVLNFGSCT